MYVIHNVDLNKFFGVAVQYQVPLYQRRYIWNEVNLERLWRDILAQLGLEFIEDLEGRFICSERKQLERASNFALEKENDRGHFTGIIVIRPIHEEALERFEVIDGQQRLTTFQVILCVIRDIFKSENCVDQANDANQLIANNPADANRYSDAAYKFIPTDFDKEEFKVVANGKYGESVLLASDFDKELDSLDSNKLSEIVSDIPLNPEDLSSNVLKAYNHFYEWIWIYMERVFDEKKLDSLLRIIKTQLVFAIMSIERSDKSEEIFESLNTTGQMLTPFECLRNNLFLRARNLGEYIEKREPYSDFFYTNYWHFDNKENRRYWTTERLDEFFRVFLKAKLGPNCFEHKDIKPYELYLRYSKGLTEEIEYEFKQLNDYAESYKEMNTSFSVTIRYMQFCDNLNLPCLESFILFGKLEEGLQVEEIHEICDMLEAYIVRCLLCSKDRTEIYTEINIFFSKAIKGHVEFTPSNLRGHLSDTCPTDATVKAAFEGASIKDPKLILYILYQVEIMLSENYLQNVEFKNLLLLPIKDQEFPDSPIFLDSGEQVWWKPELDSIGNLTFCIDVPPDNWSKLLFETRTEYIVDNCDKFSYAGQQAALNNTWDEQKIGEITNILHKQFCSIWETL